MESHQIGADFNPDPDFTRVVLEACAALVVVFDVDRRIVESNQASERVLATPATS